MAGLTVPAINLASGTEVIKGFREEENNKLPVREFDVINCRVLEPQEL